MAACNALSWLNSFWGFIPSWCVLRAVKVVQVCFRGVERTTKDTEQMAATILLRVLFY